MLTRNKRRTALADLKQQQIQPAAAFIKPLPSRDPDSVSVKGLSIISKKMILISLDSSSEEDDVSHSESIAGDLSESSKSVVEISSSDEDYGDADLSSEDEDEDVDESDSSEDVNRKKRKSSSASFASKLQVADVAKLSKGTRTHKKRKLSSASFASKSQVADVAKLSKGTRTHKKRKSSSASFASKSQVADVAKLSKGTRTHKKRKSSSASFASKSQEADVAKLSKSIRTHMKRKSSSASFASKSQVADVAKLSKGGDPNTLKVDDCRAYLRNYGLRISGTKPELIGRIKQHIELRQGGSRNYDRSTFTINCTGDVCKGDVVRFNQKVNNKGSRTVAGRVVKESYGAQRQQHTFTVEVLKSTGYCPLAPMKQLLVKGRNLYRRKTYRQKWADEGDRVRALAEKHERGDAARQVRAMKQGRSRETGGKFEPEGPSMKPLANPYIDTLASGILFQSEVSGRYNAPVRAQQHSLHRQTSYVPTGANTLPLGKIRQFRKPSKNVDINPASKDAPKPTGANTSQLGKIRHFRQLSENVEIEVSSGGVSTSTHAIQLGDIPQIRKHAKFAVAAGSPSVFVNKRKQCFKPSPVLLSSGQGCEAQNVENSSAANYNSTNLNGSHFPCPTHSCTNQGSRLCSTGVCYSCCKKKGLCRNPKHRKERRSLSQSKT